MDAVRGPLQLRRRLGRVTRVSSGPLQLRRRLGRVTRVSSSLIAAIHPCVRGEWTESG